VPPDTYQLLPAASRTLRLPSHGHPFEQHGLDQRGPLGSLRSLSQGTFVRSDVPPSWLLVSRWLCYELGPMRSSLESMDSNSTPLDAEQSRDIHRCLVLSLLAQSWAAASCLTGAGGDVWREAG